MIPYSIFLSAVNKIALKKPRKNEVVGSCKRPHISFTENPWDYIGLESKLYGTGFQTCYYPEFDKFFSVLDIDDYKASDFDIISAVPDELWDTHTVKSQSGGLHLYLMSPTPLEIKHDVNVPLDLKAISKTNHLAGGHGHLVVANYCYSIDSHGKIRTKKYYHNDKPIIEYDINKAVCEIYENLDVPVIKMGEYTTNSRVDKGNYQLTGITTNDFHKVIALYIRELQDNWEENVYYWGHFLGKQLSGVLSNAKEAEAIGKYLMGIVPYPSYKKEAWVVNFVNGFRKSGKISGYTNLGGRILNKQQMLNLKIGLKTMEPIKIEDFVESFKGLELYQFINLAREVKVWI